MGMSRRDGANAVLSLEEWTQRESVWVVAFRRAVSFRQTYRRQDE